MISRPSGPTKYCTIHWHASLLLVSNTSTAAIHSSVSTLQQKPDEFFSGSNSGLSRAQACACVPLPELLFGVQVGVEEKVNSQLETFFGHGLVISVL